MSDKTEAAQSQSVKKAADSSSKGQAASEGDSAQKKSGGPAKATLTEGLGGILGVKAGMTQVYTDQGESVAVTVIDLEPNVVTQVKTSEKDGYRSVQVGIQNKKEKNTSKPEAGRLKSLSRPKGSKGFKRYHEFRMPADAKLEGVEAGQVLSAGFLKEGDLVDLTSTSKGKGFQGVMKRYHFRGGPKSHGASIVHRAPGSIGNRSDPSKVFKGKKMAGHMGSERVTIQNVKVVRVDEENGVLLVNGSVPGPRSSVVTIRRAVKAGA